MKKIKKYYPLIVGLVLLISVAAYGTRAYFTDSTKQEAGIDLQLGTIDVTATGNNWQYVSIGENENNQLKLAGKKEFDSKNLGKDIALTDARPGDKFERVFNFKNTGTLDQVLTFDSSDKTIGIFQVSWELSENFNTKSITLNANEEKVVTAKMIITVTTEENYQFEAKDSANSTTKTNDINKLVEQTVDFKAAQTNDLASK